jgi:hypothetical protein
MKIYEFVPTVLEEVVAGVKKAQELGVKCLMPDVIAFEMVIGESKVVFEVPLDDNLIPFEEWASIGSVSAKTEKAKDPARN